ncbi:hypothetical protein AVEN_212039-1 [Araneus ventricosus]|uniref:Uncharacterized protein n=1 Tax=Araneus ventricosus TaxID=182803 RepID=A0A4Y2H4R0_ARAVE|nr:hypothetical protein AVEN_212039-1 [Araneus ventricosus]
MQQPLDLARYDPSWWDQGATPPLLCHRVDESLLTYTAASPPRTHCVPPMSEWKTIILSEIRKKNPTKKELKRDVSKGVTRIPTQLVDHV